MNFNLGSTANNVIFAQFALLHSTFYVNALESISKFYKLTIYLCPLVENVYVVTMELVDFNISNNLLDTKKSNLFTC